MMNESHIGRAADDSRSSEPALATLVHDLRNPLAPIVSALDLLRLRPDDPATVLKARDIIARQVARLNGVIDGMLPDASAPLAQASTPVGDVGSASHRQVLIVDDNIDAAESLGEFLKASGYDTHLAHDGPSALVEAARLRPDIVILDIGMPTMSGYQVARRLRGEIGLTSSLLVAVSGYTEEQDRASARDAGFDHHFAKPLDIHRLTALLRTPTSRIGDGLGAAQ